MHFFAYMARMRCITRWSLMRNTHPENVAEHTLQTAMIAHALCLLHNEGRQDGAPAVDAQRAVTLALYHEAPEVITGDLPTPVKYFSPGMRQAYHAIEDEAAHKLLGMLPEKLRPHFMPALLHPEQETEWPFVKAADRICAYLKCIDEENAGNLEFRKAKDAILKSIEKLDMCCVQEFMDTFVPSFSLTLDELN